MDQQLEPKIETIVASYGRPGFLKRYGGRAVLAITIAVVFVLLGGIGYALTARDLPFLTEEQNIAFRVLLAQLPVPKSPYVVLERAFVKMQDIRLSEGNARVVLQGESLHADEENFRLIVTSQFANDARIPVSPKFRASIDVKATFQGEVARLVGNVIFADSVFYFKLDNVPSIPSEILGANAVSVTEQLRSIAGKWYKLALPEDFEQQMQFLVAKSQDRKYVIAGRDLVERLEVLPDDEVEGAPVRVYLLHLSRKGLVDFLEKNGVLRDSIISKYELVQQFEAIPLPAIEVSIGKRDFRIRKIEFTSTEATPGVGRIQLFVEFIYQKFNEPVEIKAPEGAQEIMFPSFSAPAPEPPVLPPQ
jgi:hypothetical protein